MELNKQQERAYRHEKNPAVVLSCAGSGKTTTLSYRVAHLIANGTPANRIVCITFTNKSSKQLVERVCKKLNIDRSHLQCLVATFHKMCCQFLRKFGSKIGYTDKFAIIDAKDQIELIQQIARSKEIHLEKKHIYDICKLVNDYRENLWDREKFEQKCLHNNDYISICDEYLENRLRKNNAIDFSGLLSEVVRLFNENPDILERVQNAVEHLLVDECQDCNYIQYQLIKMLGNKHRNIYLIGDIDQSIYKFRGSDHKLVKKFFEENPDCTKYELSVNYRSSPEIIETAHKLIKHNTSHITEKFVTPNKSGDPVRLLSFIDQYDEADYIAKLCKRFIEEGNYSPEDIAILYRIHSMSEPIERALANQNIPYRVLSGFGFFDRAEIKTSLSMLRFAVNKKDTLAFSRIAILFSGLGETTIGKIENLSQEDNITVIEACSKLIETTNKKTKEAIKQFVSCFDFDENALNVRDCLEELVKRFDYEEILKRDYDEENAIERIENVKELLASAGQFVSENTDNSISDYLRMISLINASDKDDNKKCVSLQSGHSAKGLEFPIVIILSSNTPHYLAFKAEDPEEEIEEERRLFFVMLTRCMSKLYITYPKTRKQFDKQGRVFYKKCQPSQFLYEAGLLEEK